MHHKFYLSLLLAVTVLLSSCTVDDSAPSIDYSIKSDSYFKILSQYDNGWIKEAKYVDPDDLPLNEVTYHENGFIESAKVYHFNNRALYMEVRRDEQNMPLWSKYYTPEGDVWFETKYLNGKVSEKIVYSEQGTAVHTYSNGEVTSIEFTNLNGIDKSLTTYDLETDTKTVEITKNTEIILEQEFTGMDDFGAGILTNNHAPKANPFHEPENSYIPIGTSFFHNPIWKYKADPINEMMPYRKYADTFNPNSKFADQHAVNFEVYQNIIEQYPFTEDQVLIMSYNEKEGRAGLTQVSRDEKLAVDAERLENPELFSLKYGDQYIDKIHYGKNLVIIGALRNMPTNELAIRIINQIANNRMNDILNGSNLVSENEMEILNKVWFEVKLFSTFKNQRNGIVLENTEDYQAALEEFTAAESVIIQFEYAKYEHLVQ
ncbi:hypothetical protein [Christiangramia salexigens]|uniref:Uncharacterized protein n=1 Tax=Christiangramia salexigens TaxID=1913577 RepID=A0A1L3J420_9FLAO|nr:hypothetical protein [Christiangramia salexigens]APG59854.1 hypothetical protein LPB144_05235 [Christiangramia salexigens]